MFGTLGGPELFLIFVVALIVFGPRKLPDIGKSLGRMMAEFRKASNEFRSTIESEVEAEKIRDAMRIEPPPSTSPYVAPSGTPDRPASEASPTPADTAPSAVSTGPDASTDPGGQTVSRQDDPAPIEPR